ncbi:hypothetical protein [Lentzea californiensis]|uniref:hypothetical protein n=1 Tax=Lentzea californiensis TaxID=438851 RepID=UPI002166A809|nr:hypothetical protein [Lentzea californiensis]
MITELRPSQNDIVDVASPVDLDFQLGEGGMRLNDPKCCTPRHEVLIVITTSTHAAAGWWAC